MTEALGVIVRKLEKVESRKDKTVMNSSKTKIFKESKLKNGMLFLISTAFVALGIFLLKKEPAIAWGSICFFGLGVIVSLIQFHPDASYIKLNDQGFEVRNLFRSYFIKWSYITDLRIVSIKGTKMIVFDLTSEYGSLSLGERIGKLISDNRGAVPSSYTISTNELLKLMQEYKEESSTKRRS